MSNQTSEPVKPKRDRSKSDNIPEADPEKMWQYDSVSPENPLDAPVEESSFATLFPKYREQ